MMAMLFGGLIMLVFWALVIGGAIWLVVTLVTPSAPTAGQTPLDILRTRYAKGDITKEQFEEMKRDLGA